MGTKDKAKKSRREIPNEEKEEKKMLSKKEKARQHMDQLHRLQQKDPEFFEFLQEHDKDLLQFNDEDIEDDMETDADDADDDDDSDDEELEKYVGSDEIPLEGVDDAAEEEQGSSKNAITIDMVDSWCTSVQNNPSLSTLRSLMRGFHSACHSGDDDGDDSKTKLSVMSSNVFNKIMLFVLNEMDEILRKLLKLPPSGGNKEMVADRMRMKQWKHNSHLAKSYLGNSLHVLNQMTNVQMISFTLRRLRHSSVLLSAFPALLRKYIKVILHYWTGGGVLPVICFLFMRDLCMQLGSDCVEECFKGMYKTYVEHCHYVNASNLQHIQFLGICFIELLRVDIPAAYQLGFVFIRQLAMVLTNAMTNQKKDPKNDKKQDRKRDVRPEKKKDKELLRKVYEWKYINCLELWTGAICTHSSEADLRPLAYPLTQIISGVARLVPSAQYFPLRLRCIRMLNRIAACTGTYIPVSLLLVDMLEMKELHRPATGGVGEAVDLRTTLKVSEKNLKTRAFQEACVFSVVEELTEHLAQWSYSIAFFEFSFVPAIRLRNFCKSTKVERFRREMRQLIRQIELNSDFTNKKRMSITFLPNDPAATTFIENEKRCGDSPLSAYAETLRKRSQQRNNSLMQSSVLVGERSAAFAKDIVEDDRDDKISGATVFNSSWLPGTDSGNKQAPQSEKQKKQLSSQQDAASDEDLVEDLVLSDEDDSMDDMAPIDDVKSEQETSNHQSKKRKFGANSSKKRTKQQMPKKRKRTK
ncbi:hypothetical protein LIER_36165 [Lithospermum erythrorhizon]|uniref:Nucleolar complex protein 2 homolog n=1 Tax=Lithospermum erythrorhizon TaxID=34254 RepID=A0AAV3P1W8_LITER